MFLVTSKIRDYLIRKNNYFISFLIIFYSVGLIGLLIPQTHTLFINLFPMALLLSFALILLLHSAPYNAKTASGLLIIAVTGYLIEVIGVNTSLIFGSYTYGAALGFEVFNTPLMIGINWVLLVYASGSIVSAIPVNPVFRIVIASLLMLLYDFVLEQAAPMLDMWKWEGGEVPLQNYIAWLLIAVCFHAFIRQTGIKIRNPVALTIFMCQLLFFVILLIFSR